MDLEVVDHAAQVELDEVVILEEGLLAVEGVEVDQQLVHQGVVDLGVVGLLVVVHCKVEVVQLVGVLSGPGYFAEEMTDYSWNYETHIPC